MSVIAQSEVATIAPEAAAVAHGIFERYYATTLAALPGLGLSWRIDVETREADQSPEQQHQLVIWDPEVLLCYGLRAWLRSDGRLENLTGGVLSDEHLLKRIAHQQEGWAIQRQSEERFLQRQDEHADQLRKTM